MLPPVPKALLQVLQRCQLQSVFNLPKASQPLLPAMPVTRGVTPKEVRRFIAVSVCFTDVAFWTSSKAAFLQGRSHLTFICSNFTDMNRFSDPVLSKKWKIAPSWYSCPIFYTFSHTFVPNTVFGIANQSQHCCATTDHTLE